MIGAIEALCLYDQLCIFFIQVEIESSGSLSGGTACTSDLAPVIDGVMLAGAATGCDFQMVDYSISDTFIEDVIARNKICEQKVSRYWSL